MLRIANIRVLGRLVLIFLLCTIGGLGAVAADLDSQPSVDDIYRLGPGDELQVTIFGHKDLSGKFSVDGSGFISLPLIGSVKAQGLKLRELERRIRHTLKPDYLKNPKVSAEILTYRPFYIVGEVSRPGSYQFVVGMRVVNAVALAGGYTRRARKSKVTIIRNSANGQSKTIARQDSIVVPGDVIEVPQRFF